MEKYKPKETDLVGVIKGYLMALIKNNTQFDESTKAKLIESLGTNHYDTRFDVSRFIEEANRYAVYEWKKQNMELAELWKKTAVESAKISETPHTVANAVVEEFKKQFVLA